MCKIMSDDPSHQLSSISTQFLHTQAHTHVCTQTILIHTITCLPFMHTMTYCSVETASSATACAGGQRNITHHINSRCIEYDTRAHYVCSLIHNALSTVSMYVLSIVESHRQTYIQIVSDFCQSKSKRCHVIKQSKHLHVFLSTHTHNTHFHILR